MRSTGKRGLVETLQDPDELPMEHPLTLAYADLPAPYLQNIAQF
ncbi:uncharacterized protein RCO7_11662 [Rhynchosporium graminicola]|uniref:Uncharacterized protein n=1 Tax=Rhynchosporium graminicola TaxID=2792576 RepID=A0A1E1KL20_9HELO|nr:uncharacterized protein RCO7_11662 [Rhynchosporium commune]